jgi:TolB-like protein/Tfp pilus assembly protein PilF
MSSIIEGYNYDIFISYRQKDNKHDGWVTEFVNNLKGEIESAFKEEISVYFDINPHDGLLETHDVDESLKEKLKCLIFIPIISRTYCDPKSFAWEHEFKAFIEQASQDQFGLKVKLPNGNVASRVLPVHIHDLDTPDIKLCESVLGGVLRGVEFIYKEPGVDRPLTTKDNEEKNLNKTNYRNQINKVALAIREIITSIAQSSPQDEEVEKKVFKPVSVLQKNRKTRIIEESVIILILIILGFFFIPKLFKSSEQAEKSIAVLPFANLSNDPNQEYFSDGMVDAILDRLFKIGDLQVISSTSTKRYKNTELSLREIAKELGVSSILEGSVQKIGNNVRITVQLIDAKTDTHLWSEIYDKDISDIFSIQSEVAQTVARELKAVIRPEERNLIEKIPTENLEAYDYYLLGEYLRNQRTPESLWKARQLFEKAIEADPGFVGAYTGLAHCYGNLSFYANLSPEEAYPPSLELAYKALELDSLSADAYDIIGVVDLWYDYDFVSAERNYKRALELEPNNLGIYKSYSELLFLKGQFSEAVEWDRRAITIDPSYSLTDGLFAVHLYKAGEKDYAITHLTKLVGQFPVCHYYLGAIYLFEGEYEKSIDELEKTLASFSPLSITHLGIAYSRSGALDETQRMLDTLETRAKTEFVPYIMRGALMAELGREKEALSYLRKGYDEKEEFFMLIMRVDTISYANLRSDPEFIKIVQKVRFEN